MPFGPAAHTEASPTFNLWLSQWRLSILDSESARPVLAVVIKSILVESGQEEFWQHVERFLNIEINDSLSNFSAVISSIMAIGTLEEPKNPESHRHLAERAGQLHPQGAKCLLEYLSRSYSLEGEHAIFWRIVEKAIQPGESQKDAPHTPIM